MFDYLFRRHPRSVNETYREHFGVAMSFSVTLLVGAMAAAVHALLPCLFKTTASRMVSHLYGRMVTNRTHQGGLPSSVTPTDISPS